MLAYAGVCWRMLTGAGVCWRILSGDVTFLFDASSFFDAAASWLFYTFKVATLTGYTPHTRLIHAAYTPHTPLSSPHTFLMHASARLIHASHTP